MKLSNESRRLKRELIPDKEGYWARELREAFDPLEIESDNIFLTCDWHLPFHNEWLVKRLFDAAEEHKTKDCAIVGDFPDCDNISRFNSIVQLAKPLNFKTEQEEMRKMLMRLIRVFDRVFICAGNHDYRWCALTAGNSDVKDLYRTAFPAAFEGGKYEGRIFITNDDFMTLNHCGDEWRLCHPKSFRQTPLSVVRELAAIHHKHILGAHGHQWNQGHDKSGKYICLDGAGMFDRAALEYARRTSCHPMTRSGFYLLKDGILTLYGGRA